MPFAAGGLLTDTLHPPAPRGDVPNVCPTCADTAVRVVSGSSHTRDGQIC
jgi:hypothetical protein